MNSLGAFLSEYGWTTLIALYILTNTGKIVTWLEGLLSKLWPTLAEQRRLRLEKIAATGERIDTILALKDMLLALRQELDDSKMERRQLQNRLFDLVAQWERRDAQITGVLQDISTAIRSQTDRLDRISVKAGVYNARDKENS